MMKRITKISIVIVIVFFILAIKAYEGDFNQYQFNGFPYHVPHAKYTTDIDMSGYPISGPLLIDEPIPFTKKFVLSMKASALSAQNPITVQSTIDWNDQQMPPEFKEKYDSQKEHLFIIFPNAYSDDPRYQFGQSFAFIPYVPTNVPNEYKAEGKIIYPFSGNYGYLFMTTEDADHINDQIVGYNVTKYFDRLQNGTVKIESSSITASIQSNNTLLALAFIATAFGSIQILQYYFPNKS